MNRKEFFARSAKAGLGCCALALLGPAAAETASDAASEEKQFVTNWLTDLFAAMQGELDEATKVKLMAACGQGCFRRHAFKTDIAKMGRAMSISYWPLTPRISKSGARAMPSISAMGPRWRGVIARRRAITRFCRTICIANAPGLPIKRFSKLRWRSRSKSSWWKVCGAAA